MFKIPKLVLYAMVLLVFLLGAPVYAIWAKTYLGKAELARQELLAQAEIVRAEGVAKANKIIGDSLEGKESYLRYLWVQSLNNNNNKVIYVPTEANLPVLEAGRVVPK